MNILGPKNIAKKFLSYIDPFDNCEKKSKNNIKKIKKLINVPPLISTQPLEKSPNINKRTPTFIPESRVCTLGGVKGNYKANFDQPLINKRKNRHVKFLNHLF